VQLLTASAAIKIAQMRIHNPQVLRFGSAGGRATEESVLNFCAVP
jgi:hypothetical protein